MTQEHPITPPPEVLDKLANGPGFWTERIVRAFQAGADQELEACCEWLINEGHEYEHVALRDARRPKPPSLKEQALEALDEEHADMRIQNYKLIRSVLESLPD